MQSEHIKITSNGGFIVCLSLVAITTWCRIAFWNLLAYFRIFYCGKVNSLTFHYIADSPQLWWRLQVKHRQRGNHWQHLYEQKSQAVPQSKDVKHWWFSSHCSHRNLGYVQPVSLKKNPIAICTHFLPCLDLLFFQLQMGRYSGFEILWIFAQLTSLAMLQLDLLYEVSFGAFLKEYNKVLVANLQSCLCKS